MSDPGITPERVCPVLESMRRGLIDALPERKQALVPSPSGTDDELAEVRAFMALDWLIRVYLPSFLELSPACREHAERIRKLDRIVDLPSAERAGPVVQQARTAALAAADAAREAADAAADAAADDAVMRAVTAVAWAAAWAAVWAAAAAACAAADDAAACAADDAADDDAADGVVTIAAWTAARAAHLAAVSGVARRAARAAAAAATVTATSDAARGVSEDAVRQAARQAAWDVARAALGPTVESLQDSAITLYADMVDARIRGGAR